MLRGQQAPVDQLDRRAPVAQQGPEPGDVQVQALQQEHGKEQPRLVAGQQAAEAATRPGLLRGEGDRPAPDVGIPADLVGVSVMPVCAWTSTSRS